MTTRLAKLVAVFLCFSARTIFAADDQFTVPWLSGPIVDEVGMVRPSDRIEIEQWLKSANRRGRVQLQVLIVKSLGGLSIEEASIRVVDQWKLGSAKQDNGVLLMVAPQERRLRIEVGQGLEGDLPDVKAKRIIEEIMVPRFREGQPSRGIRDGVASILTILEPSSLDPKDQIEVGAWESALVHRHWLELVILIMCLIFLGLARRWGWNAGVGGYTPYGWVPTRSSGSMGGWSGGGGGFSGGGASGSW